MSKLFAGISKRHFKRLVAKKKQENVQNILKKKIRLIGSETEWSETKSEYRRSNSLLGNL